MLVMSSLKAPEPLVYYIILLNDQQTLSLFLLFFTESLLHMRTSRSQLFASERAGKRTEFVFKEVCLPFSRQLVQF